VLTVIHCYCLKGRQYAARVFLICAALAALGLPIHARAQFTGKATATGQFESDSNVFNLESGFPQPGTNDFRRADSFLAYGAAFDTQYFTGRQELYASASTNEYSYQRFTELNHDDYKIDTGLNWKVGELLDGNVDVRRTHLMVPFVDLTEQTLALSLQTEQRETADIGIKLTPDWKADTVAYTRTLLEPQPGAPNLELKESSGTESLSYLGLGNFTSGVIVGYLKGDFQAVGNTAVENPNYRQTMGGVLGTYKSGRSSFDGELGYTDRVSTNGVNSVAGVTGQFKFLDQLTPKTSVNLTLSRLISSYVSSASSEIDTLAGVGANWQATYKLDVIAGYTFTYRDYPGQGNDPVGSNRIDHQQYASLALEYRPQRWLLVRPYANFQRRSSNFIGGDFNQNIFGVFVVFQTPDKGQQLRR
jgi:hypothetical protein